MLQIQSRTVGALKQLLPGTSLLLILDYDRGIDQTTHAVGQKQHYPQDLILQLGPQPIGSHHSRITNPLKLSGNTRDSLPPGPIQPAMYRTGR
ncbi:MAG: hypothetical protein BWY63_02969 [Chloroflexi bacterium ADurb.Bin360]|nr:MAG: hypothetical protein BWY63_02969 [Chloroflexi bacterium ADurb.Bin360]